MTSSSPPQQADRADTLVGGKYRLKKPIGRGASGLIWEAEQEPIGRRVAVKLCVVAHEVDIESVTRFRRGAIALGRMSHPNIVTVHDFGEDMGPDGPEQFLVMERLEGVSMARFLTRGPLPPLRAVAAVVQLLGALKHVHEHGYVHRDVKPANLAVTQVDEDPFVVKLLDFGIARSVDSVLKPPEVVAAERRRGSRVTQPLRILGTPEYMAPEQILDLALEPGTDLYAAAVVLWQLMVGRAPWTFTERRDVYAAHLRAPVPDFAATVAPGVLSDASAWQAFFETALAKTPKKRFADASAMREALRSLPLDGASAPTLEPLVAVTGPSPRPVPSPPPTDAAPPEPAPPQPANEPSEPSVVIAVSESETPTP